MLDLAPPERIDDESNPSGPVAEPKAEWPAVISLSFGVFALVTAEFLPVSLLTPMAADLQVSNGTVGQAMTATAVVAALAGPLLVLASGRLDRRLIVLVMLALLVVSGILSALADDIALLLVARALLGFALGGYWAMMTALALRLVPSSDVPRAMSVIIMGVTGAAVVAAPVGALLGDLLGWRATFAAAAGLGVVALAVQFSVLPSLPSARAPDLALFRAALAHPAVIIGLATVVIVMSGHIAGYTFIRPFLEAVPQLSVLSISIALLLFGLASIGGNVVAGFTAARSPAWSVSGASMLIGLAALALAVAGASLPVAFAAITLWGLAFGGFPTSVAVWNARAAPELAESTGALLSSSFQVAIASGAVIGGVLIDGIGPSGVIVYAMIAVFLGAGVMLTLGRRREVIGAS